MRTATASRALRMPTCSPRKPQVRRQDEEQQAGQRGAQADPQHGNPAPAVDEPAAGKAQQGHRGHEDAEHHGPLASLAPSPTTWPAYSALT